MSLFGRGSMMMARQNTAAAAWTPDDLGAALLAWYDGNDVFDGSNPADGASLGATGWIDKSATNFDLTTVDNPTYNANVINGKGVVRFDGVNDGCLRTSAFMYANATIEIWLVAKSDESGTGALVSEGNNANGSQVYRIYDDDTANDYVFQYTNSSNVDRFLNTQNRATNDWDLVVATDYGSATGTNLEVVDLDVGTTGAYTRDGGTWNRFSVGYCQRSTSTLFFDGDIAEIVIVSAHLTGTDRTNMTDYLNTKFGKSWTPA